MENMSNKFFDLGPPLCNTVTGSLNGYADDFGRTYLSMVDAMNKCKEGKVKDLNSKQNKIKKWQLYIYILSK